MASGGEQDLAIKLVCAPPAWDTACLGRGSKAGSCMKGNHRNLRGPIGVRRNHHRRGHLHGMAGLAVHALKRTEKWAGGFTPLGRRNHL
jgi:hypothetical protein